MSDIRTEVLMRKQTHKSILYMRRLKMLDPGISVNFRTQAICLVAL
jgi:hypothetical protein